MKRLICCQSMIARKNVSTEVEHGEETLVNLIKSKAWENIPFGDDSLQVFWHWKGLQFCSVIDTSTPCAAEPSLVLQPLRHPPPPATMPPATLHALLPLRYPCFTLTSTLLTPAALSLSATRSICAMDGLRGWSTPRDNENWPLGMFPCHQSSNG